jgi:hypothetical protein
MGIGIAVFLVVLGALGAPGLILSKRPDAKQMLDKLTPFQGWIGVAAALTGAYWLIFSSLLGLSLLGAGLAGMLMWITITAEAVVMLGLGLLLGVGTMKTFIKNPQAVEKLDQTIAKLQPKQGLLGLLSIIMGVWALLFNLIIYDILL